MHLDRSPDDLPAQLIDILRHIRMPHQLRHEIRSFSSFEFFANFALKTLHGDLHQATFTGSRGVASTTCFTSESASTRSASASKFMISRCRNDSAATSWM